MNYSERPPGNSHGVHIVDDFEELGSSFSSPGNFTETARTEKEEWLAYKNSGLVKLGKGKRRSLGLAPQKLLSLSFDPIEAKVMLAEKYEAELAYHEAVRNGLVINPSTGKPRSYSAQAHALVMTAYDRCINDLLRYGYARVPEKEEDIGNEIPPVSINLTLSEEDLDDTLEQTGLIENTGNIKEVVKDHFKKLKVPVKVFNRQEEREE